jgi:hypothetical protein
MQYVYFLEAMGTGLVKIGTSYDPVARLSKLRTMSPVPLVMIGFRPGDDEFVLHEAFKKDRHHGINIAV